MITVPSMPSLADLLMPPPPPPPPLRPKRMAPGTILCRACGVFPRRIRGDGLRDSYCVECRSAVNRKRYK